MYCIIFFNPHLSTFFSHCFLEEEEKRKRNNCAREKHHQGASPTSPEDPGDLPGDLSACGPGTKCVLMREWWLEPVPDQATA